MILYRQLKMPKDELIWINKAIRTFEEKFKTSAAKPSAKVASSEIPDPLDGTG